MEEVEAAVIGQEMAFCDEPAEHVMSEDPLAAMIIGNSSAISNVKNIVRQVAFYSLHEWEMRSASLITGHDLFVPEGQEKSHRLRALLRKGETL